MTVLYTGSLSDLALRPLRHKSRTTQVSFDDISAQRIIIRASILLKENLISLRVMQCRCG